MKEEELSDRMDWLSENLWHDLPLLGDSELKYDGYSKNCGEFFRKKINSFRVELTCGAETLRKVPIKRGDFQGDVLSTFLFSIFIIPLTRVLRTANPGYEFQTRETIHHLLYMDDLKLYSRSKRVLDSLIQTVSI